MAPTFDGSCILSRRTMDLIFSYPFISLFSDLTTAINPWWLFTLANLSIKLFFVVSQTPCPTLSPYLSTTFSPCSQYRRFVTSKPASMASPSIFSVSTMNMPLSFSVFLSFSNSIISLRIIFPRSFAAAPYAASFFVLRYPYSRVFGQFRYVKFYIVLIHYVILPADRYAFIRVIKLYDIPARDETVYIHISFGHGGRVGVLKSVIPVFQPYIYRLFTLHPGYKNRRHCRA